MKPPRARGRKARRKARTWLCWAIVDREFEDFARICPPGEPKPVPSFPKWNKVIRVTITEVIKP